MRNPLPLIRVGSYMRLPTKVSLALAILALIAAAALLTSPWMNQRFHVSELTAAPMFNGKSPAQQPKTAGSPREPAVLNSE